MDKTVNIKLLEKVRLDIEEQKLRNVIDLRHMSVKELTAQGEEYIMVMKKKQMAQILIKSYEEILVIIDSMMRNSKRENGQK